MRRCLEYNKLSHMVFRSSQLKLYCVPVQLNSDFGLDNTCELFYIVVPLAACAKTGIYVMLKRFKQPLGTLFLLCNTCLYFFMFSYLILAWFLHTLSCGCIISFIIRVVHMHLFHVIPGRLGWSMKCIMHLLILRTGRSLWWSFHWIMFLVFFWG